MFLVIYYVIIYIVRDWCEMAIDIYIITLLFFTGLFIGMIYTIIGLKLPIKDACFANTCRNCNHRFKISELIPVISYFTARGRCNYCYSKFSFLVPAMELFTAFLFPMSYIKYGFSYEMLSMLIICSLLVIIFVSDFEYYIISDSPLVVASILILFFKLIFFGFKTFIISLISGGLLFLFLLVIKIIGDKIFKTDSLGGGDVKLLSFFGFTLGVRLGIVSLVLGAFLAFPYSVYNAITNEDKEIPFGPFLISGLLITFLFMDKITAFITIIFK